MQSFWRWILFMLRKCLEVPVTAFHHYGINSTRADISLQKQYIVWEKCNESFLRQPV